MGPRLRLPQLHRRATAISRRPLRARATRRLLLVDMLHRLPRPRRHQLRRLPMLLRRPILHRVLMHRSNSHSSLTRLLRTTPALLLLQHRMLLRRHRVTRTRATHRRLQHRLLRPRAAAAVATRTAASAAAATEDTRKWLLRLCPPIPRRVCKVSRAPILPPHPIRPSSSHRRRRSSSTECRMRRPRAPTLLIRHSSNSSHSSRRTHPMLSSHSRAINLAVSPLVSGFRLSNTHIAHASHLFNSSRMGDSAIAGNCKREQIKLQRAAIARSRGRSQVERLSRT